jgi:cytoskeletal protein CcmA (bactofilin family)
MLNLGRNDRWVDVKDSTKPEAKPTATNAMPTPTSTTPTARQPQTLGSSTLREPQTRETLTRDPSPTSTPAPAAAAAPSPEEKAGSKLFVGVNIKLKGVEVSDCDLLVVEGHVEATVHSKEMQIMQPGTLNGTALVDVAEVHGEFTGELTARTRLVVHGTGKVSGTIRYGKLIVAEGGTISGDMKQTDAKQSDAVETRTPASRAAAHDTRHSGASTRGSGAS